MIMAVALIIGAIVARVEARLAGHAVLLRWLLVCHWILNWRDLPVPASVVSKGHCWW